MKLRLTESKLRKMIEATIMESIQEGCLDEFFFAETKDKKSCPVIDKACYQVSKKPKKSKKTTKKALNEFMAGGNDWGRTYDDYRVNNQTNMELDEIVRDLHTICQYFDDLYSVANENQRSKYFPKMQPQLAEYVVELISPIYSLFANRTNRKGDRQGMSVEEIKNTCFDSLKQLSNPAYRSDLGVINSAAARALNALRTYTPAQPTQQNK